MVLHLDLDKILLRISSSLSCLVFRSLWLPVLILFGLLLLRLLFLMRLLLLFVCLLFLQLLLMLLLEIAWIIHVFSDLKWEKCLVTVFVACCCFWWPYRVVVILQNEMHRSMRWIGSECMYVYIEILYYSMYLSDTNLMDHFQFDILILMFI